MSSIATKLGRSLGLEDIAEVAVAEVDNFDEYGAPLDSVLSDGTPTPEGDMVELDIVYDEAFTGAEELEELVEAAQGIESIYSAMHEANENGGLTPQAARYATIALESYGVRHGITGFEMMGQTSLESFDSNQVTATTVSMEGVKETLKGWWDAIVKKFQEVMAKINKYYQENWAAAARLKKRAEAIKKKSRSVTGSKDKDSLEDKGLWTALNINGGDVSFSALTKGLKDSAVAARAAVTKDDLESKIEKQFFNSRGNMNAKSAAGLNASSFKDFANNLINMKSNAAGLGDIKVAGKSARDLADLKGITGLPGNKAIVWGATSNLSDSENSVAKMLKSFAYTVVPNKPDAKTPSTPKLPALSASEVESICDIVIDNMDQIIRNKVNKDNHVKLVGTIKKAGDKFIADLDEGDKEAQKVSQWLCDGAVHTAKQVRSGNAAVLRYNMKTSKAALSYCAKSLSNLKDK